MRRFARSTCLTEFEVCHVSPLAGLERQKPAVPAADALVITHIFAEDRLGSCYTVWTDGFGCIVPAGTLVVSPA
jgi:hypothetical protein